jgi:hypothetical protein
MSSDREGVEQRAMAGAGADWPARYLVLGPVEVVDDEGVVVPLARARQRLLLALLLALS